jgi:hypothetical protein
MDGFVRSAISTACVKVNCPVGSDNRGAVWEFAVVQIDPSLPKTSKHNVTVANFFSEPFDRIGSPCYVLAWLAIDSTSLLAPNRRKNVIIGHQFVNAD